MTNKAFITTHYFLITWLILGLALVLRLVLLNQSFWLDEAAQALESRRPLSQQLLLRGDFQPPLYHLMVHFLMLVSRSDWWLRFSSVIPSLVTIYVVILIGRQYFSRHVALLAGLFLATSQFMVFYSQELRPYSLATMFAVLSMYRWLKLLKHPRFDWWYVLFTALGFYSVYTFPFLVLAQVLMIIWFNRPSLKFQALMLLAVALFCMPWLPSFLDQYRTGIRTTVDLPLWKTAVSPPPLKALLLVPPKFIFGRLDLPNTVRENLPLVVILLGYALLLFHRRKSFKQLPVLVIWLWLTVPILLAFLVSFKVPVLDPKRVLFCLPALSLLLAQGIMSLKRPYYGLVFVLLINVVGLVIYWTNPNTQREAWKPAVEQVEATMTPDTPIIMAFTGIFAPWEWYARQIHPHLIVFEKTPVTIQVLNPKLIPIQSSPRIVVFEYLMDITDPRHLILSELASRGYGVSKIYQYPGLGRIMIFDRAPVYAKGLN